MWRIRLLRVLVPLVLVPFLVILVLELRPRRSSGAPVEVDADAPAVRARGVELVSIEGASRLFDLKAQEYLETSDEGRQRVRGVDRFTLYRDHAAPLDMSADFLDIAGEAPTRVARIEGGLSVRDEETGMEVTLPSLEVREADRMAASEGEVRFRAPGYSGTASGVRYPLDDGPTEFRDLRVDSDDGGHLEARTARWFRTPERVELSEDVRLSGDSSWMESPLMTVERTPDESWVRHVEASLGVVGEVVRVGEAGATFRSYRLEADWSAPSRLRTVAMLGDAIVQQAGRGIAAAEIVARRSDEDPTVWDVEATGGVLARDTVQGSEASLRCLELRGSVGEDGEVRHGDALGQVRFEHADLLALADRAVLRPTEDAGPQITMTADGDGKARFAQADRRVAADVIEVRPESDWMRARGRTEATLLPGGDDSGAQAGMFRTDEAVHFVSRELESEEGGRALVFSGAVRGWQGERNLSAETIRIDRMTSSMQAREEVATRLPLREQAAMSQSDFLHVTADELDYSEGAGLAEYRGNVRVRQDLGWLECDRLEIFLSSEGDAVERLTGHGAVEFRYHARDESGMPRPVEGRGDRIEYLPGEEVVRLYGDEEPAEVKTTGRGGGTTRGRVVRYGLADGRIEVEGGASIRTGDS